MRWPCFSSSFLLNSPMRWLTIPRLLLRSQSVDVTDDFPIRVPPGRIDRSRIRRPTLTAALCGCGKLRKETRPFWPRAPSDDDGRGRRRVQLVALRQVRRGVGHAHTRVLARTRRSRRSKHLLTVRRHYHRSYPRPSKRDNLGWKVRTGAGSRRAISSEYRVRLRAELVLRGKKNARKRAGSYWSPVRPIWSC